MSMTAAQEPATPRPSPSPEAFPSAEASPSPEASLSESSNESTGYLSARDPGRFDVLRLPVKAVALEADSMAQAGPADPEVLSASAGGDRSTLVEARNFYASLVSARSDDFRATAALSLLNRAISATPVIDPLDWKKRWHQRFRRP